MHADFCSRLGMTFSHGDYSRNELIVEKEEAAEKLYKRALAYAPDHRAYLGLGVLRQNEHEDQEAVKVLSEGIKHFPDSQQLHVCLGISYMNLGEYDNALTYLLKFQDSQETNDHIARCYRALGDRKKEREFLEKARSWQRAMTRG